MMYRGIMAAAFAVISSFSFVPKVDAASIALLPLVNNVIEREDLNSIYFDRALEVIKIGDNNEILENKELEEASKKYIKEGQLVSQEEAVKIANESGADVVFMMQVDSLDIDESISHSDQNTVVLKLRGNAVSYNATTGKFTKVKLMEDNKVQGSMMARYDVSGNQFGNVVTSQIKRALGIKKFTVEKPRISKAGFKGDRR